MPATDPLTTTLAAELGLLLDGRHHDPRRILGCHVNGDQCTVRIRIPGARTAWLSPLGAPLQRWGDTDLFCWTGAARDLPRGYGYRWEDSAGTIHERVDAYGFDVFLAEDELALFHHGRHLRAWQMLGAHPWTEEGVAGVRFAVWAPNAERVSVVGDWNRWDGRATPMQSRGASGVWELFVPGLEAGCAYTWKTAYDEQLCAYSPGVLLAIEVTKQHLEDPNIAMTDSCAVPDHPVMSRLWRERCRMGTIIVGLTPDADRATAQTAARLHLYRETRNVARLLRNRVRRLLKQP